MMLERRERRHFNLKKFLRWLDEDFEESILMFLLIAMSLAMMAQVIMRYFFRSSMSWPEEFCRFCFVISGFVSIGYCIRRGKMLKVDILLGLFPKPITRILDLLGRLVTLVYFSYLTYYAYFAMTNSMKGGMVSPAMQVPTWILYASVFGGSALGVIRQIEDLIRFFQKKTTKKTSEEVESC